MLNGFLIGFVPPNGTGSNFGSFIHSFTCSLSIPISHSADEKMIIFGGIRILRKSPVSLLTGVFLCAKDEDDFVTLKSLLLGDTTISIE